MRERTRARECEVNQDREGERYITGAIVTKKGLRERNLGRTKEESEEGESEREHRR